MTEPATDRATRVLAPNPGPMTLDGTNTWVLRAPGSPSAVVVDPGPLDPDHLRAVLDLVVSYDCAVSTVLLTHGHADHLTGVCVPGSNDLRFPHAQHLFPAADWQAYVVDDQGGHAAAIVAHLGPAADAGLLALVEGDLAVNDAVSLLHAPGETPGHQIVRVEAGGRPLYYLGDLFHFPAEFAHLDWVAVSGRDRSQLQTARRRVLADAVSTDATLVFTHAVFPAWGTVTPVGTDGWRWRYDNERTASDGS